MAENTTSKQTEAKNIYHLAMEFYQQWEIDPKLQVGRMITFIDFNGYIRVGKIIEAKPTKNPTFVEQGHIAQFKVECQKLDGTGTVIKTAILDYIIKEGSKPKSTCIKYTYQENEGFPLRT